MWNTNQSVGKVGQNLITDVAKIQLALLELEYLSETNFLKELPAFNLPSNFSNLSITEKKKALPKGRKRISDNKLTETIAAIVQFQKQAVRRKPFDGRVDANGRTLKILIKNLKQIPVKPKVPTHVPDSFEGSTNTTRISTPPSSTTGNGRTNAPNLGDENSVEIIGESIVIKISAGGKTEQKKVPIAFSRKKILSGYNWNGIVKLMKYVYEKNKDTYHVPTNLKGLPEDDLIIVPDIGIRYLVQQQLAHKLRKMPARAVNLKSILKQVDGDPGNNTIKNFFGQKKIDFLNEGMNIRVKSIFRNNTSTNPSELDDEGLVYDYLRKAVQGANGLWSDNQGVINLVGLRRSLDKMSRTNYNDSLIAAWKDEMGRSRVYYNVATTEPGNRRLNRQVAPQTVTVVPGFHQNKHPCGRTRNVLIRNRRNLDSRGISSYTFATDTPMNFHQGGGGFYGKGFKFPPKYWLKDYGFSDATSLGYANNRFDEEQLFEVNKNFTEVLQILSKYGKTKQEAPYQILKRLATSAPKEMTVNNGIITISQSGKSRQVDIAEMKKWVVNYWYNKRMLKANRQKIFVIIDALSTFSAKGIEHLMTLTKEEILPQIKDKFVVDIIEKQMAYYPYLSDVDGKAGLDFFKVITEVRPSIEEARTDFARMEILLEGISAAPLKDKRGFIRRIKNEYFINTDFRRQVVKDNRKFDEKIKAHVIHNAPVGSWSEGCQVIFDPEQFFTFWNKLMQAAAENGQRRWYYTLVNAILER